VSPPNKELRLRLRLLPLLLLPSLLLSLLLPEDTAPFPFPVKGRKGDAEPATGVIFGGGGMR
jgi:hypothetical protein